MCPIFKKLEKHFGNVMLHYCTTPSYSRHVLPALCEGGGVNAAESWQGLDTLVDFNNGAEYQDKVALCFDVNKNIFDDLDKFISQPLFHDVKRKGGRGLVVGVRADNPEEGKKLYNMWRERFSR